MNYQEIYEKEHWYGDAHQGRCPGNRLFPIYKNWLSNPVLDIGCGRGHTVELLRKEGYDCDGIDQIKINPDMLVGDVTKPLGLEKKYNTCLCIDVIEHITDDILEGLFENFKLFNTQIFSIHNGPSIYKGEDLHVNRKSFDEWDSIVSKHFNLMNKKIIHHEQILFHTEIIND